MIEHSSSWRLSNGGVGKTGVFRTAAHSLILSLLCAVSYLLITQLLAQAFSISRADDQLGGMWAVAATIFVYRSSSEMSFNAAVSRMSATLLSFLLCLIYLLLVPFSLIGMVTLIGIGAATMSLLGRPDEIITTGITTTVVMVVAGLSPHQAWKQPILRLFDTIVGVGVGVIGVWVTVNFKRPRPKRS